MKTQVLYHFGDRLRLLLSQPYVTTAELRSLLRKRGVFCGDATKDELIPFLTGGLLSEEELNLLSKLAIVREQTPKRRTSFACCESDLSLNDVLKDEVSIADLIKDDFRSFEIVEETPFTAVDGNPDALQKDYKVRRTEWSRDWTQSDKEFSASVIATKNGGNVEFVAVHSSVETEQINNSIKRTVVDQIRVVSPAVVEEKLTFAAFDNINRVRFFKFFTDAWSKTVIFDKATDLGVRPAETSDGAIKDNLKWMINKVSELRIAGDAVHDIEFLTDDSYYPQIIITRMEARYFFKLEATVAICDVVFEFADFSRRRNDAEFQIGVKGIRITDGLGEFKSNQIEKIVFESLESRKTDFLQMRSREAQAESLVGL